MAAQIKERMTVEAFDTWVNLPENMGRNYEYIAGESFEVVSNNYCSQVAMLIGAFITLYVKQHNLGHVTGADGGYHVRGERYIPDVGFVSKQTQPEPCRETYNPNPPELAVEVVSPTDQDRELLVKLSNYLAEDTVVWIVYPDQKEIHVHRAGQGAAILSVDDTLKLDLLPGFSLLVKEIFPVEAPSESS